MGRHARRAGVRRPIEIRIRYADLPPEDVTVVHGLRVTTVFRTLVDLSEELPVAEIVRLTRQALDKRLITLEELEDGAIRRTDLAGIGRFREALSQVVGSQPRSSP